MGRGTKRLPVEEIVQVFERQRATEPAQVAAQRQVATRR
jgi:hypothetical protein